MTLSKNIFLSRAFFMHNKEHMVQLMKPYIRGNMDKESCREEVYNHIKSIGGVFHGNTSSIVTVPSGFVEEDIFRNYFNKTFEGLVSKIKAAENSLRKNGCCEVEDLRKNVIEPDFYDAAQTVCIDYDMLVRTKRKVIFPGEFRKYVNVQSRMMREVDEDSKIRCFVGPCPDDPFSDYAMGYIMGSGLHSESIGNDTSASAIFGFDLQTIKFEGANTDDPDERMKLCRDSIKTAAWMNTGSECPIYYESHVTFETAVTSAMDDLGKTATYQIQELNKALRQ